GGGGQTGGGGGPRWGAARRPACAEAEARRVGRPAVFFGAGARAVRLPSRQEAAPVVVQQGEARQAARQQQRQPGHVPVEAQAVLAAQETHPGCQPKGHVASPVGAGARRRSQGATGRRGVWRATGEGGGGAGGPRAPRRGGGGGWASIPPASAGTSKRNLAQ